jgi:hypothetical protein
MNVSVTSNSGEVIVYSYSPENFAFVCDFYQTAVDDGTIRGYAIARDRA